MLIISQNKETVINFNNVIDIIINKYANACPGIACCTLKDFEITLGEYATEERAKEVLQEIIKAYKDSAFIQLDSIRIENKVVYEMPEK